MKMILAGLVALAATTPALADDVYTLTPTPAPDTRNSFVAPSGSVYVVNQQAGTIALCFPDTDKNKSYVVVCTPVTKLPQ